MPIRAGFSSKRATITRAGRAERSRPAAESMQAITLSSYPSTARLCAPAAVGLAENS